MPSPGLTWPSSAGRLSVLHDDPLLDPDRAEYQVFVEGDWLRCPATDSRWPAGEPPLHGPACVVADGWGSLSHPRDDPPFRPLVDILTPTIAAVSTEVVVRGLSYKKPGRSYCPSQTDIPLLDGGATRVFRPYAPDRVATTYVGFSLGGLLTLAGAANWVRAQPRGNAAAASDLMRGVVLLQPALSLDRDVVRRIRHPSWGRTSQVMQDLIDRADEVSEMVMAAVGVLREASVDVAMLYWAGDGLLDYTRWAPDLTDAGVTVVPLPLRPAKASQRNLRRLFGEHALVPRFRPTRDTFEQFLRTRPRFSS